jgi:molecular chaperone DnaJ
MYISFSEAAMGTTKEIDAISSKVRIKIEEGTQSGKILRLRGKGLPSLEGYGRGDLLVHINVWTPQKLSREQRDFFEKMKNDNNFIPDPSEKEKSFFEKVKDMFL